MRKQSLSIALVVLSTFACALGGCASARAADPQAQGASDIVRELNRADAIASAREDALRIYGSGWGAQVDAQYQGGFWVVELRAPTGYRLRYAISARDGSIRERNMIQ
jgi:hypothetical protein